MKSITRSNRPNISIIVPNTTTREDSADTAKGHIDSARSLIIENTELRSELQLRDSRVLELEHLVIELQLGAADNSALHDAQAMLVERIAVVDALSADLETMHKQNEDYRCQTTELIYQIDSINTELFAYKDQNIALHSSIAQLSMRYSSTQHSSSMPSEYDTLHAIICDMSDMYPEVTPSPSPMASLSIHRIVSDKESNMHLSTTLLNKNLANVTEELRTQLEAESYRASQYVEQLEQCALTVMSRENEISTLIATQLSILTDHELLHKECVEQRAYRIRLQTQLDMLTEMNNRLLCELRIVKDKYMDTKMANIKKDAVLSLGSRSSEDVGFGLSEEVGVEGVKGCVEYVATPPAEYTETLTQKLLLDFTIAKLRLSDHQIELHKVRHKVSELEQLSCDLKFKLANTLVELDEQENESISGHNYKFPQKSMLQRMGFSQHQLS